MLNLIYPGLKIFQKKIRIQFFCTFRRNSSKMKKSSTRLQLIMAAAETFHRYGFKKTTMDDIAFAAGKGKSSLYYYFKNKEEVFEAVVDNEADQLKNDIYSEISKKTSAVEKLRSYIMIRMKRFAAKGNLYQALNDNFLMTFTFIERIRNKYREWELNELGIILQFGIEKEEFKKVNIPFMSQTLLTAMVGFELPLMMSQETEAEFEQHIHEVIDMLFYGICT